MPRSLYTDIRPHTQIPWLVVHENVLNLACYIRPPARGDVWEDDQNSMKQACNYAVESSPLPSVVAHFLVMKP
jgi:hypothetical protein